LFVFPARTHPPISSCCFGDDCALSFGLLVAAEEYDHPIANFATFEAKWGNLMQFSGFCLGAIFMVDIGQLIGRR